MYFDELNATERYEKDKERELTTLISDNRREFFEKNRNESKELEIAKNNMRKRLIKFIRLGLVIKTQKEGIYERGDESIVSAIYAKCLTNEFLTRRKHLDKMRDLILKTVTIEDIKKAKQEVAKIGFTTDEYVLLCQITAVIHKAFENQEIMEELTNIFRLLFRNVENDFLYTFNLDHLSVSDFANAYIDKSDSEMTACVFFAHRYAKELSVHIWTLIHPWLTLLLPHKHKDVRFDEDSDIRNAYDEYALNLGVTNKNEKLKHDTDPLIASIIEKYEITEPVVFYEGCNCISSLQKELLKYLDKELENSMSDMPNTTTEEGIQEHTDQLKESNIKLSNQLTILQEKCSTLQNTINALEVEKEMNRNKCQKEFDALNKKYRDSLEELELYRKPISEIAESVSVPDIDLKDKRIMIIGGHDRWHQIIKSVYPNWILINDEKVLPTDLRKVDGIFFFTKYMSHSLYRKYSNQCRIHNIPFYYLTSLNLQAVEDQIRQILRKTGGNSRLLVSEMKARSDTPVRKIYS